MPWSAPPACGHMAAPLCLPSAPCWVPLVLLGWQSWDRCSELPWAHPHPGKAQGSGGTSCTAVPEVKHLLCTACLCVRQDLQ